MKRKKPVSKSHIRKELSRSFKELRLVRARIIVAFDNLSLPKETFGKYSVDALMHAKDAISGINGAFYSMEKIIKMCQK